MSKPQSLKSALAEKKVTEETKGKLYIYLKPTPNNNRTCEMLPGVMVKNITERLGARTAKNIIGCLFVAFSPRKGKERLILDVL